MNISNHSDVLFLHYPKCSTSQKAKKWLNNHQISYCERNIKEHNPTFEELTSWYHKSGLPLKKFFNTSGLVYKNMNLKETLNSMSEDEKLHLLSSDGMLVKRPLIIAENFILIGFKETEWEALLLSEPTA